MISIYTLLIDENMYRRHELRMYSNRENQQTALNDDTPIEEYYCFTNHIVVQSSSQRVQPNSQVIC